MDDPQGTALTRTQRSTIDPKDDTTYEKLTDTNHIKKVGPRPSNRMNRKGIDR